MATAKQSQPSPSLAPLGVVVSIIVAVSATYFMLPGVLILWLGVMVSAMIAKPPQLTGPKDPLTQYPTPGNPGEKQKQLQYRFWQSLKFELWFPDVPWPITFAHLTALGGALIAVTLPTTLLHPSWAYANAVAAYILISKVASTRRRFSAEDSEKPATELLSFVKGVEEKQRLIHVVVAGALSVATLVLVLVSAGALDWYLLWPHAALAAGTGVLIFAMYGHAIVRAEALEQWRQTTEAREAWKGRWASMAKVKEPPRLISHERVGEDGEGWIDIFEAPASEGAQAWIPMPQGVEPTLPPNTIACFMSAPDLDADGRPITVSRSAIRFKAITWRGDAQPDINDPSIDPEVLAAWLELCVTKMVLAYESTECALIPTGPPVALHEEDSETAAWKVSYGLTSTSYEVPDTVSFAAKKTALMLENSEVYSFEDSLFLGAVTADSTQLQDESIIVELEAEAERERWKKTWTDMASALQAPRYFPELNAESDLTTTRSASPMTITRRLFVTPNGSSADVYFNKISTEQLRTALGAKPWAALTHFVQPGRGRYAGGIAMYWSEQQIPRNPAEITPGDRPLANARPLRNGRSPKPRVADAVQWAITGSINEGFISAKLTRPEVLEVQPLTDARSDIHIWTTTMRLHGGVTAADVKKAAERIRQTIGCDWLRVTEHREGCLIACGALPSHPSVKFRDDASEQVAISLDWEQAFLDSKVAATDGRVPELISLDTLPKNDLVKEMVFRMPPGVDLPKMRDGRQKLSSATNNLFLDIQQGDRANEAIVRAAVDSPMPDLAPFDWDEVAASDAIPFATDIEGGPVTFDPIRSAHALVLGKSGSGKSACLQSILVAAAIRGWELWILDSVKFAADYTFMAPYAKGYATKPETVSEALRIIYEEVQRRVELNVKHSTARVSDIQGPDRPRHMLVLVDELLSSVTKEDVPNRLTGNESPERLREIEEARARNQAKEQMGVVLARIAREARSAGVSLVAATQSLTKQEVDTAKAQEVFQVKKQAGVRILLGKSNYGERVGAFNVPDDAPDLGESVPLGRGIMESAEGAPIVFQSWFDGRPKNPDGSKNPDAQTDHLASMLSHISDVREPEVELYRDEDLMPKGGSIDVFGAVIDSGADASQSELHEEEIVDVGEIELDLDLGLSFSIDEPEHAPVPDSEAVLDQQQPLPVTSHPEPGVERESAAPALSAPGLVPPPASPVADVAPAEQEQLPGVPPTGGLVFEAAKPRRSSKPTIEIEF